MYAHGFRFYFTPLSGVLFAFPSRYWFTIGRQRVFSLGGWSPHVQAGLHVSRPTLSYSMRLPFHVRGYHPLWPDFPDCSTKTYAITSTGLFRVRSPLLTESRLISIPPVTEMFQFTGFAPLTYVFSQRYRRSGGFPHSEIFGSKHICRLPEAYRRLSRPSSPSVA